MTTSKVFLTPNPHKAGAISRVVIVGQEADGKYPVLDIDTLAERPALLKPYGPGYQAAAKFWSAVSSIVLVAGIALSFFWAWWAFIPGFVVAMAIFRANKVSVADFANEIIKNNPGAVAEFASSGLVWEAAADKLVIDRT